MLSDLMGERAQEIQDLGVVRVDRQYLRIGCLGLSQPSCLMVLQARLDGLRDRFI